MRKIKRPLGAATPNGHVENIPSMTKGVVYPLILTQGGVLRKDYF